MTKSIAVVSAGGHARSVADVIFSLPEYKLVSFLDTPRTKDEEIFGIPVSELPNLDSKLPGAGVDCLALGHGNNFLRSEQMDQMAPLNKLFPTLVHSDAYIGHDVEIGAATVVMPGVNLNASAMLSTRTG